MASMNKPSRGSTNWYQDVTDNWTSIETNLIDKSLLSAKGDVLVGSAASTPARQAVGTDKYLLEADSGQSNGLEWVNPELTFTTQEVIDLLWGKAFFEEEGFLPSTKIFEYLGTPTAFAGTAGLASWTGDPGAWKPNNSGIGWYDLGSAMSKILIVVGNLIKFTSNIAVHLTPNVPTGLDPDGFSMWNNANGPCIQKRVSGVYTRLDSALGLGDVDYRSGYALYYDDSTGDLKVFMRTATGWFLTQRATSSDFTTLRYVAFQAAASGQRWVLPFVCYAQ